MNESFSMERLTWLLRADLVARYRTVLIIAVTVAVLVIVQGMLLSASPNPPENIYAPWFLGMLFIWGPIAASQSFRELHDKSQNEAYLLLPASALEKTLARLLLITVVFGLFVLLFFLVLGWLNAVLNFLIMGRSVATFSPPEFMGTTLWLHVIVVQSVFFLGAAWFRKAHFVKTNFAITLGLLALILLAGLMVRVLFGGHLSAFMMTGDLSLDQGRFLEANRGLLEFLGWIGRPVYFAVLPPFCWWVVWLRVKETQVSYGV